jgi:hypothetical protein
VPAAHGGVIEESELGDIVQVLQVIDLKDDLQQVIPHLAVTFLFSVYFLKAKKKIVVLVNK